MNTVSLRTGLLVAAPLLGALLFGACKVSSVDLGGDGGGGRTGTGTGTGTGPTLDPQKLVTDLTEAEAQAWCEWYIGTIFWPDLPLPEDALVYADGFTDYYAMVGCGSFCAERLSINHCVTNLMMQPCAANVAMLDECASTVASGCNVVGEGCARYLTTPSCDGTIVTTKITGSDCWLKVQ